MIDAAASAADLLLPRHCLVCGRLLGREERPLCTLCLSDLPLTGFPGLARNPMSASFNHLVQNGLDGEYRPYSYAAALIYYGKDEGGYSSITKALKYRGDFAAGRFFAATLADRMVEAAHWQDGTAVVPVPLHWTRYWKRGYNQAAVIGQVIASRFGIPMLPGLLSRRRRTASQATLSAESKEGNVSSAFKATAPPQGMRHILIVDDVYTTGSTLHACYEAFRAVTDVSVRISVATLAVVQERLPE